MREGPDPFLLPSDTPFRFALLVIAVLATSLFTFQLLWLSRNASSARTTFLRCFSEQQLPPDAGLEATRLASHADALCRQPMERGEARWMLVGIGLLGVVTVVLMVLVPWLRRRRGGFVGLEDGAPELEGTLVSLAEEVGVSSVRFEVSVDEPGAHAFTYGLPGRRRVVLRAGLVVLAWSAPSRFRAVVLHELAHIRNRDVDQTYAALCVSAAFALVAVPPLAVVLDGSLSTWSVGWRVALLAVLVLFLLVRLLRSREQYADARAARLGVRDDLIGLMETEVEQRRLLGRPRLHPAPSLRAAALRDPAPLFGLGFVDGLTIGLVAALAAPQVRTLASLFTAASLTSVAWAEGPFAALLAATAVTSAWRRQAYERSTGRSSAWTSLRLPLGLALGLAWGPEIAVGTATATGEPQGARDLLWHVGWSGVWVAVLLPLCLWLREGARAAVDTSPADTAHRRLLLTWAAAGVLTAYALVEVAYRLEQVRGVARYVPPDGGGWGTTLHPLSVARTLAWPDVWRSWPHLVALVAVLALPWLCARPGTGDLLRALRRGALAGSAVLGVVVLSTRLADLHPLRTRWPLPFGVELGLRWTAAAWIVGAAGGAWAGARARSWPLASAAAGGASAALVGVAVLALVRPLQSCVPALTTGPFTTGESATARCPAWSTPGFVSYTLQTVLAGALGLLLLVAPLVVPVTRAVLERLHVGLQGRRVPALAARVAVALAVIAALLVSSAASVARAVRAAAGVEGSIGDAGTIRTSSWSLQLLRGWLDVTRTSWGRSSAPEAELVLRDSDVSGVVLVRRVRGTGLLEQIRRTPSWHPRTVEAVDGASALRFVPPQRPPSLSYVQAVEHQGATWVIELHSSDVQDGQDDRDLQRMLATWRWS